MRTRDSKWIFTWILLAMLCICIAGCTLIRNAITSRIAATSDSPLSDNSPDRYRERFQQQRQMEQFSREN